MTLKDQLSDPEVPFTGDKEHLKAHKEISDALAGYPDLTAVDNITGLTAVEATTGEFDQIGIGTAAPGTATSAAPIKGFYRTGTAINVRVPAITDPDDASVAFSVAAQYAISPGDLVVAIPRAALPTNCLQTGSYCLSTSTVTVAFASEGGDVSSTTVSYHVFSVDMT